MVKRFYPRRAARSKATALEVAAVVA